MMTGLPISSEKEAETAARAMLERGVRHVILTLGSRGCLLVDKESATLIPAPKVHAIDTTGAGW